MGTNATSTGPVIQSVLTEVVGVARYAIDKTFEFATYRTQMAEDRKQHAAHYLQTWVAVSVGTIAPLVTAYLEAKEKRHAERMQLFGGILGAVAPIVVGIFNRPQTPPKDWNTETSPGVATA